MPRGTLCEYVLFGCAVALGTPALGEEEGKAPLLFGRVNSSIGYEHTQDLKQDSNTHAIWSFRQQHDWAFDAEATSAKLRLQYQIQLDTADAESLRGPDQDNLEKLILYVEKPWGPFQFKLGQQEVSWGENLLMPILDLVNPRDISHPRGYYDPASKMPVPMINVDLQQPAWNAQLIAVPQAIPSRQPDELNGFGIEDKRRYRLGLDGEYGGRLGVLVKGVDLKLYSWNHWPRVPSYRFTAYSGTKDIELDERRVDTTGLSLSYAEMNWLLRADFAHHLHFPATQIGTQIERSSLDQMILGWSWTTDTLQTLGVELHAELWEKLPSAYVEGPWVETRRAQRFFSWLGLNGSFRLWDGKVEPQILGLRGLNTEDKLLRIFVPWNFDEAITLGGEYQTSQARSNSPKVLLSQQETLSLRVAYSW